MAKRLLLIDDDDLLRATLREQLEAQGEFQVTAAADAAAGLAHVGDTTAAAPSPVDLVLLDVHLPDMDGRDACRRLREAGLRAPILMLTGAGGERDTIRGLESGADDYISKPCGINVLLARIRASLRRHERSEDAEWQVGPFRFRPGARLLLPRGGKEGGGAPIRLTEKETSVLKYLYRAEGRIVPREELLRKVWGYKETVLTHTLETHIYRLRAKLRLSGEREGGGEPGGQLLRTEQGGYRLAIQGEAQ